MNALRALARIDQSPARSARPAILRVRAAASRGLGVLG
jgi:hypothetical protein